MKKTYYILVFIFSVVFTGTMNAQDKIVFRSGKKTNCKIMAINPHTVTYKDSANGENLVTISKKEILMAEYKSGSVYIFGNEETEQPKPAINSNNPVSSRLQSWKEREATFSNNLLGIQLPDLVFGRFTMAYERLFMDKMLGVVVPVSLTYDTRVISLASSSDTSKGGGASIHRNVNFITGLDVNFYYDTKNHSKFFVGPRFRYGTDVLLGNVTASSLQFQSGFFFPSASGRSASTISLGFGFARIIAVAGGAGISPKQSYPWLSFTYRLSFRLQKPNL